MILINQEPFYWCLTFKAQVPTLYLIEITPRSERKPYNNISLLKISQMVMPSAGIAANGICFIGSGTLYLFLIVAVDRGLTGPPIDYCGSPDNRVRRGVPDKLQQIADWHKRPIILTNFASCASRFDLKYLKSFACELIVFVCRDLLRVGLHDDETRSLCGK